jgi:hypothetical protein
MRKSIGSMGRAAGLRWLAVALLLVGWGSPAGAQELVTARFEVEDAAAADSVRALGVDVVEIRARPDGRLTLVAVVSDRDRRVLLGRGIVPVEVPRSGAGAAMEERRARLGARAFAVYRDFDDPVRGVAAYLREVAAARANVFVESIGASVEGRPILAVKIGSADDLPSRPNVLFMSTYHAREWAATEAALRLLTYLADSLPSTAVGAALLASRDVWVIPVVNPDGYQYTFTTTRLWRKNRRPNDDGSFGVDLNRNHTSFFALDDVGSSPSPPSGTYRGPSPESEPEIQAVAAFHRAHPPVAAISYHTYTPAVLYPWGHANGALSGDDGVFRVLAGTVLSPAVRDGVTGSSASVYHPGPGWHLYPTNGDYTGWAHDEFATAAFTVELTAGCCWNSSAYGFEFPDDDAMLGQVFRDNLPFALALLEGAGDLSAASGPAGLPPPAPQLLALWPRVRALVPVSMAGSSLRADVVPNAGPITSLPLGVAPFGRGREFALVGSDEASLVDVRALRISAAGLEAEILARDGAEREDSPWVGFGRESVALEGASGWVSVPDDTLLSPEIGVAGRRNLALYFWTRHEGSVFTPDRQGVVDLSTDGGLAWTTVHVVAGSAPEWYPVSVALEAPGASAVRLRFIARSLVWRLDAIALAAGETDLFGAPAQAPVSVVAFSANPVRNGPVTIRWPAGQGTARVEVFTPLGARVAGATLSSDPGRWQWDLTSSSGGLVTNGVYLVVVTRADGTRLRRRLFVARRGP